MGNDEMGSFFGHSVVQQVI